MPTTIGAPNQVLSRAPNFNPEDPETFKTVWQTVSGGSGGSVNNPMTSSLNANNFNITNLNAIQLTNGLYFSSAFVPEENHVLYVAFGGAGPIIDYKKAVFNPVEENINMNDKSITNNNNIETKGISSSTGTIAVTSILNMFNDINMDSNDIFNVDRLTTTHAGISLNLDMIPATEGKANQYLARDPSYSPGNFATHKLVWQTPSGGGGGVQNPMNTILDCNGYGLVNVSSLTSQNSGTFNILLNGNIISNVGNSLSGITNLTGFNATMTLNGEIKIASIFKSNNISPSSGTVLTITAPTIDVNSTTTTLNGDIKIANTFKTNNIAPNTGTTLTVTSPILALNSSSNVLITSPSIITTGNITLGTNKKLITTLAYADFIGSSTNTDLTIGGITEDGKTETNIVMSAPSINLNNNFSTTVPDTMVNINGAIKFNNTITTPFIMGPNITISGITSAGAQTPLTINATNLNISNQTSTTENCNIKLLGALNFDNVITDSIIRGGYLYISSKYADETKTPLYLSGSTIDMTSDDDIKITVPANKYIDLQGNVIVGDGKTSQIQTDFLYPRNGQAVTTSNLNVLRRLQSHMTDITTTRNVRSTLFKYYGPNTVTTNLNTITPVPISISNGLLTGSKSFNAGDIVSGDKLCFTLTGLLTTAGGGNMNIYVYGGLTGSLVQTTSFTLPNIVLNNEIVKMTIECDCIVTGSNLTINNVAFCSFIRNINSTVNIVGTIGSSIPASGSPIFEIYASHSILQTSSFKLLTYSMEVY